MSGTTINVFMYTLTLFGILLLIKIMKKPLKIIFKIFANTIIGSIAIICINTFSAFSGFYIALNAVTASICGIFGLSGILFMILFKIFF